MPFFQRRAFLLRANIGELLPIFASVHSLPGVGVGSARRRFQNYLSGGLQGSTVA